MSDEVIAYRCGSCAHYQSSISENEAGLPKGLNELCINSSRDKTQVTVEDIACMHFVSNTVNLGGIDTSFVRRQLGVELDFEITDISNIINCSSTEIERLFGSIKGSLINTVILSQYDLQKDIAAVLSKILNTYTKKLFNFVDLSYENLVSQWVNLISTHVEKVAVVIKEDIRKEQDTLIEKLLDKLIEKGYVSRELVKEDIE